MGGTAEANGGCTSGKYGVKSEDAQPGSTPELPACCQPRLPTDPLGPVLPPPPGPVLTWPQISAFPTSAESERLLPQDTSPLSFALSGSYFPPVLLVSSVESKLSALTLLPFMSMVFLTARAPTAPSTFLVSTLTLRNTKSELPGMRQ